ncbi:ABC transporter permease [Neglectibacter caecimuris]|uniref:ABC transporter permease n=1 Tax=Neglectibacter caecimuris TaxID=3093658 RepID=UPI002AC8B6AA|nr:ABC transporter permease subunit [Neglectibacter sp. M00184]
MRRKTKHSSKLFRYLPLYLMMLPGCAYLIINNYIPMTGIVLAFKQYHFKTGIYHSPNVGFKNFKFLFTTKDAWVITRNTICYNLVFILLGTVLAVGVAILLNEIRAKLAKKLYQTVILIPFLISIVIVSYLVYAFLNTENGFLNNGILKPLGKSPISWYSSPQYWPVILVIVNLWKGLGYNCILFYATLLGIDRELYEAAVIDGASRWQQIKHITLPGLKTTLVILTLMSISKIFYSDFGLFYQVPMNQGTLMDVTNTIDTYVYRGLMTSTNLGMTAAAGLYQSFVGFVLVVTANLVVRRIDPESALF